MRLDAFRARMNSYRKDLDDEAAALKHSQMALAKLLTWYRGLSSDERRLADSVLDEWIISESEAVRFDALALIDEFKVTTATSALRRLADRLGSSPAAGAPFELKKIERVLRDLTDATVGRS
jgi:hypothetical protein